VSGDCATWFAWLVSALLIVAPAQAKQRPANPSSLATRAEQEAFLAKGTIVTTPPADGRRSWRASLDNGDRRHDVSVETADGSDPTRRNYRLNVAAYELNKLLGLDLVPPSAERSVGDTPASVTWWVDDVAMNELDRRRKGVEPSDLERWNRQMQAVRFFDELISNTYRDTSPPLYLNSVWDNLLITKDWTIWLTDHTGAFRTRRDLQDPESLVRCPRLALSRLRSLNRERLQQTLGNYLSPPQLDALEARRVLLVKRFDDEIARRGDAVLYDLTRP
jgi:hypothetical protein